jgi:hypothetical protein
MDLAAQLLFSAALQQHELIHPPPLSLQTVKFHVSPPYVIGTVQGLAGHVRGLPGAGFSWPGAGFSWPGAGFYLLGFHGDRCRMYTGHVTAGGSICLEALTNSGTAGAWQPDMSVESLLHVVIINMIDCPSSYVQTATGPGGRWAGCS